MRLYEILLEDIWSDISKKWSEEGVPAAAIANVVGEFKRLKAQNIIKNNDIQFWANKPFDDFYEFVASHADIKSKTQVKKEAKKDQIVLRNDDEWYITIPLTEETSCLVGKNTTWCTTSSDPGTLNVFNEYLTQGVTFIYCIRRSDNKKWAISATNRTHIMEFNLEDGKTITQKQFVNQTGLDPVELRREALSKESQMTKYRQIAKAGFEKTGPSRDIQAIRQDVEGEIIKAGAIADAYVYATEYTHRRFLRAEDMIATDPEIAVDYAKDVIRGRFVKAEPTILASEFKDDYLAFLASKGIKI